MLLKVEAGLSKSSSSPSFDVWCVHCNDYYGRLLIIFTSFIGKSLTQYYIIIICTVVDDDDDGDEEQQQQQKQCKNSIDPLEILNGGLVEAGSLNCFAMPHHVEICSWVT